MWLSLSRTGGSVAHTNKSGQKAPVFPSEARLANVTHLTIGELILFPTKGSGRTDASRGTLFVLSDVPGVRDIGNIVLDS